MSTTDGSEHASGNTVGDLAMVFGSWNDTQAMVGTALRGYEGADPVNFADIRRRLEVLEWDCPLHYDRNLAHDLGHPSPPSPVTMLKTWAMPAYWTPSRQQPSGDGVNLLPPYSYLDIPAPGTALFATNVKTTYEADLYDGDRVVSKPSFRSMTRKTTSVGEGAFLVIETEYFNQHGQRVAVEEFTVFRFTPNDTHEG